MSEPSLDIPRKIHDRLALSNELFKLTNSFRRAISRDPQRHHLPFLSEPILLGHGYKLGAPRENAGAAEARIMNADIAEESASLVKYSIKNNVTAAILAQTNVQPRIALDLLKNI